MTEPAIERFLKASGIDISAATISRMIMDESSAFHQEKAAIVNAGLQTTDYQHIDDTGAKVNGKNAYTHVLCSPYYTAYFTRPYKDRLTILAELGARTQARKRDISLQNKNSKGVEAKDSGMTVVQTAKKLGVNSLDYIQDRVSEVFKMPSLASITIFTGYLKLYFQVVYVQKKYYLG